MSKGKTIVQACHASIEAFLKSQKKSPETTRQWIETGMQKTVLKIENLKEMLQLFETIKNLFPTALIKDAGKTQLKPGTITALGIGPAPAKELDRVTGKLKLL